ncbi:hypothetical protein [Phormidium sp. CCY1219]|uniref:hypothetical protein n=1 Tax=Phormidium sp. CCY1219 TaxID=2886104 RepID=UPI002D1F0803|nr:hypothetical protein [Phormidium sp. CCY1219]MEB3828432.1 hypothetical protein [Phormidium sp. CCY1219]
MGTEQHLQPKGRSKPTATSATRMFQVRPFAEPANVESTIAPELQTKAKSGENSDRLSRIEISQPSAIQPKLTIGGGATSRQSLSDRLAETGDRPSIQRDTDDSPQPEIASEDIEYEIIAHSFAYKGEQLPAAAGDWLSSRGYERNWALTIKGEGFFMGLLMPLPESGRTPILAFKGTSPDESADVLADLDPVAIGFTAFKLQQKKVADAIALAGGKVDVVGHSLGGALAQHAASAFPPQVRRVVTFQAPAINRIQSYMFGRLDETQRPEVRHHIATGDIVDLAGGKHLAGEVLLHHVGGSPLSHIKYLLNSDAFKEQREALGLTDEMLEELDIAEAKAKHSGKVEEFEEYPYWFRQLLTEWGGRGSLGLIPGAFLAGYRGGKKLGSGMISAGSYLGDKIVEGGSYLGDKIVEGGSYLGDKIVEGGSYVGDKIVEGGSYVGDKISSGASSIYEKTRDFFRRKF